MKNKLQQMRINLISRKERIINLKIENEQLKYENNLIQENINDLRKILIKSKNYVNKKKKLKVQCIAYSIFCFILASILGPILSVIIGLTNISYIIILSILTFIPFYPVFMCMFYNEFHKYSKIKKFLKNNNVNEIDINIKKLEHKIEFNKEIDLVNNRNIDKLKQEIHDIYEKFENDNSIKLNNNDSKEEFEKTREYKKIKTLKI